MELTPYEKLQIFRTCLTEKRWPPFSEDEFLEIVELYETDADFKAFCDADDILRGPMENLATAWWVGSAKHMRDYFYQFRDFCYGTREQPPDTQSRILLHYQSDYRSEMTAFRERCDADPVVRGVIEQWLRDLFVQLRGFCSGTRKQPPGRPLCILHLYLFTGPVFRELCDADPVVLEVLKHWVRDLFDQLRDFCYGTRKRPPSSSLMMLAFYRSEGTAFKGAAFREQCDADPVVREVIEQWLREEAQILK